MEWLKRLVVGCAAIILILAFIGGVVGWYIGFHDRGINWDFDPVVVAQSETRMWQYYYTGQGEELGLEMIALMREVYGASLKTAYSIVMPMAKGTMIFAGSRKKMNYEERVLPHLELSYKRLAESCGRDFDPRAAAKAELAWWVARRTKGEDSPEQVGELIAQLYGLLYGARNENIDQAAFLRARAAQIRDQGGQNANWGRIERMLIDSYTTLKAGIQENQ